MIRDRHHRCGNRDVVSVHAVLVDHVHLRDVVRLAREVGLHGLGGAGVGARRTVLGGVRVTRQLGKRAAAAAAGTPRILAQAKEGEAARLHRARAALARRRDQELGARAQPEEEEEDRDDHAQKVGKELPGLGRARVLAVRLSLRGRGLAGRVRVVVPHAPVGEGDVDAEGLAGLVHVGEAAEQREADEDRHDERPLREVGQAQRTWQAGAPADARRDLSEEARPEARDRRHEERGPPALGAALADAVLPLAILNVSRLLHLHQLCGLVGGKMHHVGIDVGRYGPGILPEGASLLVNLRNVRRERLRRHGL
mmetsp:Transcript_8982/g.17437  ORF Transcript_8982/g.17437 Transcript_8982/m.17437 type:complete len:311 (+) Transcript_8982:106-1038(+)